MVVLVHGDGPPELLANAKGWGAFESLAGLEERPWLNATIDEFVAEALRRNVELDVLNHPAGHHAFDVFDDDDRSRDIVARTLEFLGRHLSRP